MNTEINYRNCYIKKFPLHYTDDDLKDLFLKYGTPISCKVERDETGKSKGFGYCSFVTHEEAARAVRNLNGLRFNGKQIVCEPFLPREIHERTEIYMLEILTKQLQKKNYLKYSHNSETLNQP